jgi:SAM-dependent methyltransferase
MPKALTPEELEEATRRTLAHYTAVAESFRVATWDHDVSQNHAAFLSAIEGAPPFRILDLGCGPGRDLAYFKAKGHQAIGLDGADAFVRMARETGCEVLHQDFLKLALPRASFDGIFANASLLHVPEQELPRVLGELRAALVARGVLFCSNPHGRDTEGYNGDRYGAYLMRDTWNAYVVVAGFELVEEYYRPAGKPRHEQPWLATVWRGMASASGSG